MKFCLLIAVAAVACACTPAQLDQVRSASDKKSALCSFAEAWAPDTPALREVRKLCMADAQFEEIARAYAGCPTESDED